jgi:PAS domain S-box-containing protein
MVGLARDRLGELRARLRDAGVAPGSAEVDWTLHELEGMLAHLQARYAILREILERTSDIFFAKDPEGRYVMINPKGAGLLGKSVTEIVGQDDTALFERASAERIMAIDRATMSTGEPSTFEETVEIRGKQTRLLTTEVAWNEPGGKLRGLIGITQDVTERRQGEKRALLQQQRLRALAAEIVIAEESLRQALVADLHNGLGQDIALAKMRIAALRSASASGLSAPLLQIEHLVEQADRSLRSIAYQLSPPSLHDLGLLSALQWLAEDTSARYGFEVRVEELGLPAPLDERMRAILFRAVRELVLNAARHARAHEVRIRLAAADGQLCVRVQDDGSGFDATQVDLEGYGLFGVREQLRHVGGSLQIDSAAGRGTTVTLVAPFTFALPVAV